MYEVWLCQSKFILEIYYYNWNDKWSSLSLAATCQENIGQYLQDKVAVV